MIEKYIYFDLDINMVAMTINRILKELNKNATYQTIVTDIERTSVESKYLQDNGYITIQKYTLIIIASNKKLSKQDIMNVIKDMYQPKQMGC
jgi:predicted N-formylglutamate amidohydrolase